jgi:hypothetical protein
VLRVEKKNDYNIKDFSLSGSYFAYTDAKDTQVFHFDHETLMLRKVSAQICEQNNIKSLPSG